MTERSKTFCVYPWMQMMTNPTGQYSYCCVAKPNVITKGKNDTYKVGQDSFAEAFNSPFMQRLRKDMLEGKHISGCASCYHQESIGKNSYRMNHNDYWSAQLGKDLEDRIERSMQNDYLVDEPPVYLDLRLGNLCNLKCRMCNHYNSSQIAKESEELLKKDHEFKKVFASTYKTLQVDKIDNWYDGNYMWSEIIDMIPHLKKVYLTGGEPTLIENNYKFMREILNKGHAKDIELFFNTNCTNGQQRFLELIEQFSTLSINCSLDGYRAMNDYIRYPSKWPKIEKVFVEYAKRSNINLGITPVFQVYNVLNMAELLTWVDQIWKQFNKRVKVDILINYEPAYLNIEILPASIKLLAAKRLQQFSQRSDLYGKDKWTKNSVDSSINMLMQSMGRKDEKQLQYFIKYTRSLDKNRKQSFKESCPELWQMLSDEGYET